METKFVIYTDGSSKGNPGPGGFGAIIIGSKPIRLAALAQGDDKESVVEIGGREEQTTNNRMEMMAVIEALRSLPEKSSFVSSDEMKIEIYTDSEYLMKGATVWIKNWQKNNWRTKDKREVMNRDLWEKLLVEIEKRKVEWKKVLGHSGHKLNERCDEIATEFADGLDVDLYEGPKENYKFH